MTLKFVWDQGGVNVKSDWILSWRESLHAYIKGAVVTVIVVPSEECRRLFTNLTMNGLIVARTHTFRCSTWVTLGLIAKMGWSRTEYVMIGSFILGLGLVQNTIKWSIQLLWYLCVVLPFNFNISCVENLWLYCVNIILAFSIGNNNGKDS